LLPTLEITCSVLVDRKNIAEIIQGNEMFPNFDILLVMHVSINLVNDQLDAQFFYFIIRLLQSSTCFGQRRVHQQEVKLY